MMSSIATHANTGSRSQGPPSPKTANHKRSFSLELPNDTPTQNPATASSSPSPGKPRTPRSPQAIPPSPILVQPLPSTSSLERESQAQSELEYHRQIQQRRRERELAEALQEQEWELQRAVVRDDIGTWTKSQERNKGKGRQGSWGSSSAFARPPQAYELYQAIDKKDIDFIMRVRDHAFGLLLQKNAGEFPILYASRIGPGHRDVVILLIGAMSRFVNHLDDEDFGKKETQRTLKALRSNLKLAIDNALLPGDSPHLLSSYLQVLIMSEGDTWLHKAVYDLSLLLRDPKSRPVEAAERMVRGFCTKELRGVQGGVGDVEEYIANAALDLVIMGVWSLVAGQIDAELLPTHTFARDLRTYTMLCEAMSDNQAKLHKVTGRLKGLLQKLHELGGDSRKSVRGRLRDVQAAVDGGD